MSTEQKVLDVKEFTSLMLSCLLAAEFNKSKPNKAIKHALRCVKARALSDNTKRLCTQGLSQAFPLGWINNQLSEVYSIGNLDRDEFLTMGANL